jgi:uncharacterized protein (DUF697 family)
MPRINPLTNIWTIVKEADLRPLREQAERPLRIAIAGRPGSGRAALAERLRRDPARPELAAMDTPLVILDLDAAASANEFDLTILMISGDLADTTPEQQLVRAWHNAGKQALVFINFAPAQLPAGEMPEALPAGAPEAPAADLTPMQDQPAAPAKPRSGAPPAPVGRARSRGVVRGALTDQAFLTRDFALAVIELIPDRVITLGRYFPFFRVPAAHYMINDTCFSNAAYAFSTGLAEMTAVMNVPIAMTDMIILTKNQLFLVYKLGLALGYSTRWQDYVAEFGGVLGTGFLWRQLARSLVGMIPVWGIVPKTAISYAGTYTVGNVVLQWYLTGRHLEPNQIKDLYLRAFENGKDLARRLLRRAPRLRKLEQDGEGSEAARPRRRLRLPQVRLPRLARRRKALPPDGPESGASKACPECGRLNAADARFCQYCGHTFES